VHLPVQSGSDRVLAAMKRNYTAMEYRSIIRRLRAARPGISISSDFIVGFPGETEADFQQTLDLIAEVGFDQSFSFIYSMRPGTPAASLPDQVPHEVKPYLQLAHILLRQGNIREVRQLLLRTLDLSKTILAYRALGDIALNDGKPGEAVAFYEGTQQFKQSPREQVENGYLLALALSRS
jgi:radical SAM superfamily enzyme YgiQ (UPF0313 family)